MTTTTTAKQAVRLQTNISWGGKDYGPDYGTPIAELPHQVARDVMRRGQGRPAFLGPCDRDTARCDTATDPTAETAPCCVHGAMETLRVCTRLFDAHDIRWWVDYGSLLAVACGGRFFWNDKDHDLGVLADDQEKVLRMRPLFEAEGFQFSYARLGPSQFGAGDRVKLRWSRRNRVNTDMFFWHPHDAGNRCGASGCMSSGVHFEGTPTLHRRSYVTVDRKKGREFPVHWLGDFPLPRLPLEGLDVPVPHGWEELGEHRYGTGFPAMVADVRAGVEPFEAARRHFPPAHYGAEDRP